MDGAEEVPFVPLFKAPHHIEFLNKVFFFFSKHLFSSLNHTDLRGVWGNAAHQHP